MADVVTGTLRAGPNAVIRSGIAAVVLVQGDVISKTTGNQLDKSDATSVANATFEGIVLHGGLIGDAVSYQAGGDVNLGVAISPGLPLYISATPGKLADTPPASTNYITQVGLNISANDLRIGVNNTGVAMP